MANAINVPPGEDPKKDASQVPARPLAGQEVTPGARTGDEKKDKAMQDENKDQEGGTRHTNRSHEHREHIPADGVKQDARHPEPPLKKQPQPQQGNPRQEAPDPGYAKRGGQTPDFPNPISTDGTVDGGPIPNRDAQQREGEAKPKDAGDGSGGTRDDGEPHSGHSVPRR